MNELLATLERERQARATIEKELAVLSVKEPRVLPSLRKKKKQLDGARQQDLLLQEGT